MGDQILFPPHMSLLLLRFPTINNGLCNNLHLLNQCSYTVWPGTLSAADALLGNGGFILPPSTSVQFTVSPGWSDRFWARTGCNFDSAGNGHCTTGDCGSGLQCNRAGGVPPVTLAEFTIVGSDGQDFYDVSLVDGYNVGVGVKPSGGSVAYQYPGCIADLNQSCPPELTLGGATGVRRVGRPPELRRN